MEQLPPVDDLRAARSGMARDEGVAGDGGTMPWTRALSRLKLRACESVGAGPVVLGRVSIPGRGRVRVGARVRLDGRAVPVELNAHRGGGITLGDGVRMGPGASVEALESITVGDNVELGPFCKVLDSHFHRLRGDRHRWTPPIPVVIERDAVVGERAILLPGAHLAAGARVPPGAIVARRGRAPETRGRPPAAEYARWPARFAFLARTAMRLARGRHLLGRASAGKRICASGFVRVVSEGALVLGDAVEFLGGMIPSEIVCRPGAELSIGAGTIFNYGASVEATRSIRIGRGCLIASMVVISDRDEAGARPVTIGDQVWVAHGAVVRPGVTVGDGSVIGAGSVVSTDVPAQSLALGNPARALPLGLVAR